MIDLYLNVKEMRELKLHLIEQINKSNYEHIINFFPILNSNRYNTNQIPNKQNMEWRLFSCKPYLKRWSIYGFERFLYIHKFQKNLLKNLKISFNFLKSINDWFYKLDLCVRIEINIFVCFTVRRYVSVQEHEDKTIKLVQILIITTMTKQEVQNMSEGKKITHRFLTRWICKNVEFGNVLKLTRSIYWLSGKAPSFVCTMFWNDEVVSTGNSWSIWNQ